MKQPLKQFKMPRFQLEYHLTEGRREKKKCDPFFSLLISQENIERWAGEEEEEEGEGGEAETTHLAEFRESNISITNIGGERLKRHL